MPLTELQCKTANLREKPYKLADGGGMYLEVTPAGSKYWRLKYRSHGKEKRLALGVYPTVSLAEARKKREDNKASIREGKDPSAIKQENKRLARLNAENTFEAIAVEWHKRQYDTWSPHYADSVLRRLQTDVFPEIGKKPIADLKPIEVVACLRKIENRGAGEMAYRALQMCGQIMRYAVHTGRATLDITASLKGSLKKRKQGHYAAIETEDLPKFLRTLDKNDARLFKQTKLAVKLIMLTFVRTIELIASTWDEFDLENSVWIIPPHRMKMRRQHVVPLSKQAVSMLYELKELTGKREYVFPSISRPKKHMSNATILRALDRIGYKGIMTGHGFRALAMSTIKEKLKYTHEVVDRQLAHKAKSRVDQAYDRATYLDERRIMMQDWADYIDKVS